jgi:hypothetical protein
MMKIKLFFTFLLLLPLQASALTAQEGLNQAASGTGLDTSRNIPQIIALVVNALLALLATIFIILIILGGFRWMTSAGNASKIDAAKQTITNAVIGLVIVMAAYAISKFILGALVDSTNGGGGEVTS